MWILQLLHQVSTSSEVFGSFFYYSGNKKMYFIYVTVQKLNEMSPQKDDAGHCRIACFLSSEGVQKEGHV